MNDTTTPPTPTSTRSDEYIAASYAESLDLYAKRLRQWAEDADGMADKPAYKLAAAIEAIETARDALAGMAWPPHDTIVPGDTATITYDSARSDKEPPESHKTATGGVQTVQPIGQGPANYSVVIADDANEREVIARTFGGDVYSRGIKQTTDLGRLVAIEVESDAPQRRADGGLERPADCACPMAPETFDIDLPCWPCVSEGFEEPNPDPPTGGPRGEY